MGISVLSESRRNNTGENDPEDTGSKTESGTRSKDGSGEMQIDYKRDLNHTYVILQEEKEPDTASYQIRMLLTNAIPGLLDCKIGKMDDKTLFYYEVTSRQSLQSVFEQRSIGAEALRKLFEQLLDLLEELGQYLLAPDGLVLQPELVFADANLENFSFCYLPGKQGLRSSESFHEDLP